MADPISLASGILSFAVFALHASRRLYETIDSFKSNKRVVRELGEELVALQGVLVSLQDTIKTSNTDLKALELPLHRCGKACEEFEAIIAKCSSNSGGVRAIRDWAKVQYMGNDITGFRVLLAGYKSTITIAICDVNMRTTNVTAGLLSEYKTMIEKTTSELEDQLEEINMKLERLADRRMQNLPDAGSHGQLVEKDKGTIEEDKKSIEQCLGICVQVLDHIDQLQVVPSLRISSDSSAVNTSSTTYLARQVTTDALNGCKTELVNTASVLQKQLNDIQRRLTAVSNNPESLGSTGAEEIESIKQCLAICSQASEQVKQNRVNVFEDIKTSDDGEQIVVATLGDLISAKRVTSGSRSIQWLGQMSDASLQHLADKRVSVSPPQAQRQQDEKKTLKFEGRHGTGHKLIQ
ncbi:uncharacterized protein DFL_006796 [Arthrobotrys flagrans]|uniref:Azaphilone pigments biosynthesis cluster protein L N-terminal domain-containing protein n=1 Tax=Arthrobotrys flagrans TaxID=97331 RepID=A0A436ZTY2_ARTFL|nr:hypothetical protein DFL_006796 [Arthrobotrys flagrans]